MKMEYFSKGKRGKIYLNNDYAIKKAIPSRIKNEVRWLKILNKYNIGPKLVSYNKNSFKYHFINGDFIIDFIIKNNKVKIKRILLDIIKQCRMMDKLKVNKKEMHIPIKHIIVKGNEGFMIDFERCYKTEKPKNVTQFCQFIMSNTLKHLLRKKGLKINKKILLKELKNYKHSQNEKNFKRILRLIT
jgi:predicted Ser/Thr protein kinase